MRPRRVDFYDPLYDFVTFEEAAALERTRGFLDAGFGRAGASTHGESISPLDEAKVILPFLSALEFTRQSFLRQSNLAFLVYPSATHTRFAHAVGSCYLGFIASQRVAVGDKIKSEAPIYLSKFLEDSGWREEFYLALLLHDVGHYPFSHALENNRDFWEIFGVENHHEEAACQLIQGSGSFYEASVRRVALISKNIKKDHPHLCELFNRHTKINKDAICYLISGDKHYLGQMNTSEIAQLQVVHELVSGLLDLDRVDHYRRDNLFTGLRTGTSLNFPSLLSGLTIFFDPQNPEQPPELRLSPSAIGPAISLLQNKERLTEDCFDHPDNIAYETMLHHAFNRFVFGEDFYENNDHKRIGKNIQKLVYDLLLSTDEQLLFRFEQTPSRAIKEIVFRIINRAPYTFIAKFSFARGHRWNIQDIRSKISSLAHAKKTNIVLRVSKRFGGRNPKEKSREWLDLDRLLDSEGKPLINSKYKRQIEHFKLGQDAPEHLWLYTNNDQDAAKLKQILSKLENQLGCVVEEEETA